MELTGIKTPLIKPGDDMVQVIIDSLEQMSIDLAEKDIIVLAESAVGSAEGRVVELASIVPGKEAIGLGQKYQIDPRKAELILRECDEVLGGIPGVAVTITKGVLAANAGIDSSNAPPDCVVLLPEDPQKSAADIRERLMARYGCSDLGVIIADSRTQPLRLGCVGVALGCAGIEAVEDARGTPDLFGKPLMITRKATADNLVCAAEIIMGEANEGIPAVLIRNAPVKFISGTSEISTIGRDECLYFVCFNQDSVNRSSKS